MSTRKGPRSYRLSKCERILRAIIAARMRFIDDGDFVNEVNSILIREGTLNEEEFGKFAKRERISDDM